MGVPCPDVERTHRTVQLQGTAEAGLREMRREAFPAVFAQAHLPHPLGTTYGPIHVGVPGWPYQHENHEGYIHPQDETVRLAMDRAAAPHKSPHSSISHTAGQNTDAPVTSSKEMSN